MKRDLATMITRGQELTARMSARDLASAHFSAKGLTASYEPMRADGSNLYLYDAIGGWDGTAAIDVARALAEMDGPIHLHFNSPGGFIFEGTAMFNVLRQYTRGPITSWVDGYAASAASFVMLAASPYDAQTDTGGVRMADNGFVMVHDGMGLVLGTADDMREGADLLDMLSDTIAQMYANRTGGTAEQWRQTMTDGDTWYTAPAALDAKLVDLIVGQAAPAPSPESGDTTTEAADSLDLGLFQPRAIDGLPVITNFEIRAILDKSDSFDFNAARDALRGALSA